MDHHTWSSAASPLLMSSRATLEGQQVFQRKLQNLAGNREVRYRVSTKFFVKSRWDRRIANDVALALAFICGFTAFPKERLSRLLRDR